MCIVEALRVVEAARSGKDTGFVCPWCNPDKNAVKRNAAHGILPVQPAICEDNEWDLIKQMCAFKPEDRIKISTAVDELTKLANANLDSQHDSRAAIPPMNCEDTDADSEVVSSAQEHLWRLQGSTDRREAVLSLYISLLESQRAFNLITKLLAFILLEVLENGEVEAFRFLRIEVLELCSHPVCPNFETHIGAA
ncbi:hypothetical protein PI126_g16884 [Phytophthora idaei]|nr:hypothetical protein PI126_g16884 [Phytophthora idaei]